LHRRQNHKAESSIVLAIIDAYPTATATDLVAALRARQVSSVELTETAIARIEAMDGVINAVVVRDFERARVAARAADEALARGEDGALLGLPMTVKETYDLEGQPTTWGVLDYAGHRAVEDAAVVQRLKSAGAVILGKTNVPVLAADWQSGNPVYGVTKNPIDLTRSPGGSSGGGSAALAVGYVALEVGSDIGGSIRIPAAFCGVYGHKASYGIVPTWGASPGGTRPFPPLLSVPGPMARSAADLAMAMDVLAGPWGEEAKGYALNLPVPRGRTLADYRVLVVDSHPSCATGSDVKAALDGLAARLEGLGARVSRDASLLPNQKEAFGVYMPMLLTITTRRAGEGGRAPISSHAWLDLLDAQARIRRQWAVLFESFDVVVAPAFGACAFPATEEADWRKRRLLIDGQETDFGSQLAWAAIATLPNLPATAMPLGLGVEGLPIGAQVIGPYLEDRMTIAFADLLSQP
jgi:amidase